MKPFWQSRTLWLNGLVLAAVGLNALFGPDSASVDTEGNVTIAVLTILNGVLRFNTSEPIEVVPTPTEPVA